MSCAFSYTWPSSHQQVGWQRVEHKSFFYNDSRDRDRLGSERREWIVYFCLKKGTNTCLCMFTRQQNTRNGTTCSAQSDPALALLPAPHPSSISHHTHDAIRSEREQQFAAGRYQSRGTRLHPKNPQSTTRTSFCSISLHTQLTLTHNTKQHTHSKQQEQRIPRVLICDPIVGVTDEDAVHHISTSEQHAEHQKKTYFSPHAHSPFPVLNNMRIDLSEASH